MVKEKNRGGIIYHSFFVLEQRKRGAIEQGKTQLPGVEYVYTGIHGEKILFQAHVDIDALRDQQVYTNHKFLQELLGKYTGKESLGDGQTEKMMSYFGTELQKDKGIIVGFAGYTESLPKQRAREIVLFISQEQGVPLSLIVDEGVSRHTGSLAKKHTVKTYSALAIEDLGNIDANRDTSMILGISRKKSTEVTAIFPDILVIENGDKTAAEQYRRALDAGVTIFLFDTDTQNLTHNFIKNKETQKAIKKGQVILCKNEKEISNFFQTLSQQEMYHKRKPKLKILEQIVASKELVFPPEMQWNRKIAKRYIEETPVTRWGEWLHEENLYDTKHIAYEVMEKSMKEIAKLLDPSEVQRIATLYQDFLFYNPFQGKINIFASVSSFFITHYHFALDEFFEEGNTIMDKETIAVKLFKRIIDFIKEQITDFAVKRELAYVGYEMPFLIETGKTILKNLQQEGYQGKKIKRQHTLLEALSINYSTPANARRVEYDFPIPPQEEFYFTREAMPVSHSPMKLFINETDKNIRLDGITETRAGFLINPMQIIAEGVPHMVKKTNTTVMKTEIQATRDGVYAILLPKNWQQILQEKKGEYEWFSLVFYIESNPDIPTLIDREGTVVKRETIRALYMSSEGVTSELEKNPGEEIEKFIAEFPDAELLFMAPAGVIEGLTLEQHIKMFLERINFGKRIHQDRLALINRKNIEFIISDYERTILALLHDIAKPPAVRLNGRTKMQHAFTRILMKQILPQMGFAPERVKLLIAIMDQDWIGMYIRKLSEKEKESMIKAKVEIKEYTKKDIIHGMRQQAKELGLHTQEEFMKFFYTILWFSIDDIAAYGSQTFAKAKKGKGKKRGLVSLDHVIDGKTMWFSNRKVTHFEHITYKEHVRELIEEAEEVAA